jgi:hypothetical protein
MKPTLTDVLHTTQYSTVTGRNILDATSALRDIIAAGTRTSGGICIIALDFNKVFDNVFHTYLYGLLTKYNYGTKLIGAILSLYNNAQSRLDINGHIKGDIPIHCSIRQGCPLSSILYASVINPFLILLNTHLRGIQTGPDTACIAYEDDVSHNTDQTGS